MRSVWLILLLFSSAALGAEPCLLWEDSLRITHVKATDERSTVYCLGYLHGRDRAWQMDYFRRTVEGTNSEVHGFSHLKGDLMMRLLDLPSWASKLWETLAESERTWLQEYTRGVNHGFRVAKQQPTKEFRNGHPTPAPWLPLNTLAVLLLQSFDQTRRTFAVEWDESKAMAKWGDRTGELFNPDGVPWDTTVLKAGEYPLGAPSKKVTQLPSSQKLWAQFPAVFGEESGSNNWAVAPGRTKNGAAIFANDPHLDLRTPMFWYWVHLESPTGDVIGASLPGVPLIVSGANRKVAWGLTNAYIDSADAVRLSEKESEQLTSVRPLVWVKWGWLKLPFFFKSFDRTPNGYPVLPLENPDPRPLVLKWAGFHLQGSDLRSMRDLMTVASAQQMEQVLSQVGVPAWNFVYADIEGKIGHRVVGKAFRMNAAPDYGFREGTLESIDHPNFLTPEEMPHVVNPARGWIASANNRHWPSDAVLHGGRGYSQGFRAQRIDQLLAENSQHDVDSFTNVQCDFQAADGPHFVPQLVGTLRAGKLDSEQAAWVTKLESWDFSASLDCEVCGIYRRTLDAVMEDLQINEIGFWRLGNEKHADWVASVQREFQKAWGQLKGKRWGEIHSNSFAHLSNRSDWVYSPRIPTRGDKHSVNPGSMRWEVDDKRFEHTSGASERLIVEMKATPEVWLTLPGLNARYDDHQGADPWKGWESCQRDRVEWPVNWSSKKLERVEVEL